MAGFLGGLGEDSDTTSQIGAPSSSQSGDLSGTTSLVSAAAAGGQSGLPTTPTATVSSTPSITNPNAAGGASSGAMNQLADMRTSTPPNPALASGMNGAVTAAPSYLPTGASPTGIGSNPTTGTSGTAGLSSGASSQLITDAKSFIGVPYVYGGTSTAGLDCSGFTQAAYAKMGINIGRNTTAQMASGQVVGTDGNWSADVAQLQPGDLIFYGEKGASGPNAHVVMYIGNGQIIQAAHTGTNVAIGNLFNSASSDEPFAGVRRYMTTSSTPTGGVANPDSSTSNYAQILAQNPVNNQQGFASDLLSALGDQVTPQAVQGITDWENAEGGNWHNSDTFNPLNTTMPDGGSHGTNGPGVQAYSSWLNGLTATVNTLKNGLYSNVLQAIASGNPQAIEQAVASSKWGTGAYQA